VFGDLGEVDEDILEAEQSLESKVTCPISQELLEHPMTNAACKHSDSQKSIKAYLLSHQKRPAGTSAPTSVLPTFSSVRAATIGILMSTGADRRTAAPSKNGTVLPNYAMERHTTVKRRKTCLKSQVVVIEWHSLRELELMWQFLIR
jgi:hypothetical protein